jgi:tRNA uridine 5-carbamoylmethylation protein Kti12
MVEKQSAVWPLLLQEGRNTPSTRFERQPSGLASKEDMEIKGDNISLAHHIKYTSVVLLCGLPGSGKSTVARQLIASNSRCKHEDKEVTSLYDKVVLIDYDAIAEEELVRSTTTNGHLHTSNESTSNDQGHTCYNTVFDSTSLDAWRKSRMTALNVLNNTLRTHFSKIDGLSNRHQSLLVIIDDNFHLRSMRREVYRVCQDVLASNKNNCTVNVNATNNSEHQPTIGYATIHVSTPLDICLERNRLRTGKRCIPEEVITRMDMAMEPPDDTKACASFERFHTTIDNSSDSDKSGIDNTILQQIVECIHASLQSPITPKDEMTPERLAEVEAENARQREKTLKCQVQRIDQLLRKLVGAVGRVDQSKCRRANDIRKLLLEKVKSEEAYLDDETIANQFAFIILEKDKANIQCNELNSSLTQSIQETLHDFVSTRKPS